MANGMNQCNFTGNLGADPEVRFTTEGKPVATISLGVGKSWKDKNGQKQDKTEWVRAVAFEGRAEVLQKYTRKGSKLRISAEFRTRKYQDQSGQDKYISEFHIQDLELLDSRQDGQAPQEQRQPAQQQRPTHAGNQQQAPQQEQEDFDDDSIPF